MPSSSLKPGGLFVDEMPDLKDTPAWCSHLLNPVVHRLKLAWMPRFVTFTRGNTDEYDIPDLMTACEAALLNAITANNVTRYLLMANLHNAAMLKSETLDFLLKNKSAVIVTKEWK